MKRSGGNGTRAAYWYGTHLYCRGIGKATELTVTNGNTGLPATPNWATGVGFKSSPQFLAEKHPERELKLTVGQKLVMNHRNVSAPLPKFRETFVDNGYLDMYQVMRALGEVKFDGIVIPDHVPGGGYPMANTTYTLGYMKALRDRVKAEVGRA